jgi:hypothetical protein
MTDRRVTASAILGALAEARRGDADETLDSTQAPAAAVATPAEGRPAPA